MSRYNLFESLDSEEDELDSLCNNNACSSGKAQQDIQVWLDTNRAHFYTAL